MINWLTDWLGTASYYETPSLPISPAPALLDVRELIDREGNTPSLLREKIQAGLEARAAGHRVVVCCDRGVSRSNAVALGILLASGMSSEHARELLREKLGEIDVNLGLLRDVRALFQTFPAGRREAGKILVTGASGFVGRAVMKALEPEHELVCLDRAAVDLIRDLHSLDACVSEHGIGFILHLAHPRMRNNTSALPEALAMTRNILEVCRLNKIGMLYLSGLTVFSGHISREILLADSTLNPRPRGPYGETKFLCEELIQTFSENYGLRAIILRPAALYGAGMDRDSLVSKFFTAAGNGDMIRTHVYRNGPPVFDFLCVDDLVEAIQLALDIVPPTTLNIGTGVGTSTYELARQIAQITSSQAPLETIEMNGDTSKVIASPREAVLALGWRAKTDLETGLKEMWREACAQRSLAVP